MNLTAPQKNGLLYFHATATKTNQVGKFGRRFRCPDPRVIDRLSTLGLIVVTGYHYGAIFALSARGAELAQSLDPLTQTT